MNDPKPLDSIFKDKIFRIPDYQRGYAWQKEQLRAFWEDLINLPTNRSHYTGVLTLREIPGDTISESSKEYWLVNDHSYHVYHIVDGQQRLTTVVVLLQALADCLTSLPEYRGVSAEDLYLSDSLSLADLQGRYLFRTKPKGDRFRTYMFGYTHDNPSYDFLRYRILGEEGGGSTQETFYTLNLSNAKTYFMEQFRELHGRDGKTGIQEVLRKLTKFFLFNEYVIKDEFDVFVAFETMNNRGKKLSALELLKNRLIYLTTLYEDNELDAASRKSLRDSINDAWKEIYHQLGRNKARPLNDDDFLRAHWTMYFKYSRQTGRDFVRYLLDERFTPQNIHKKVEREVALDVAEEQRAESDIEDDDDVDVTATEEPRAIATSQLQPFEIRNYVNSLKASAAHWFNSFNPGEARELSDEERLWLERLNRLGMVYFRPLVMAILKNEQDLAARVNALQKIERFIFIAFRMDAARANYRSSEFLNATRAVDRKEISLETLAAKLDEGLAFSFHEDGSFRKDDFFNMLSKRFRSGSGYYGWSGLRYFLYEYELSLLSSSRQKKVDWADLLKSEKDRISIEHVYPQTETKAWEESFKGLTEAQKRNYCASLGNLLVLSSSINSALQNDSFEEKKFPKLSPTKEKLRNGYSDGSHSEIEVSRHLSWGPQEIADRGLQLLQFMQRRWAFHFHDRAQTRSLLFLEEEAGGEVTPKPNEV